MQDKNGSTGFQIQGRFSVRDAFMFLSLLSSLGGGAYMVNMRNDMQAQLQQCQEEHRLALHRIAVLEEKLIGGK